MRTILCALFIIGSPLFLIGGNTVDLHAKNKGGAHLKGSVISGMVLTHRADEGATVANDALTKMVYGVQAVLRAKKRIFSHTNLLAQVQGSTMPRYVKIGTKKAKKMPAVQRGALLELAAEYAIGKNRIRVGRFLLPKRLSPIVYSNIFYWGQYNATYEGVWASSAVGSQCTLYAGYIHHAILLQAKNRRIRTQMAIAGFKAHIAERTLITAMTYHNAEASDTYPWEWAAAGMLRHSFGLFESTFKAAYARTQTDDESYSIGTALQTHHSATKATLYLNYSNNGALNVYGIDTTNPVPKAGGWASGVLLKRKFLHGTALLGATYAASNATQKKIRTTATIGYSKMLSGVRVVLDYRHNKVTGTTAEHRLRAKAIYKF
jgi:hypothetical protein